MNYFDNETPEETFSDQPEEISGQYDGQGNWIGDTAPPAEVKIQRPTQTVAAKPDPQLKPEQTESPEYEDGEEDQDEETTTVLTDARLRLEMGKLYELIMKHELFDGVEADPKAIKSVQKEIRAYAQERMEIMLGMRQEPSKELANAFPMDSFPFNSMEVEVLKALAATATKGESRDAAPLDLGPQAPPARTTLNPIGKNTHKVTPVKPKQNKPLQKQVPPVKRGTVNQAVQRILAEEGVTMDEVNQVFDEKTEYLDRNALASMTEEQIIARNKAISLRNKRVNNPAAAQMPTADQMAQMYEQRSQVAEGKPGWRELIGMVKAMPPTKTLPPRQG